MKACNSCQWRGYSRELCYLHAHRCQGNRQARDNPPSLGLAGRVAMGVAVGVFAALTVSVAASFFSGLDVFRALLPILVVAASIPGAVYGFVRGSQAAHARPRLVRPGNRRRLRAATMPPSSRTRLSVVFLGHATAGSRATGSGAACH